VGKEEGDRDSQSPEANLASIENGQGTSMQTCNDLGILVHKGYDPGNIAKTKKKKILQLQG